MSSRLSIIPSVHNFVMLRTGYFGWICKYVLKKASKPTPSLYNGRCFLIQSFIHVHFLYTQWIKEKKKSDILRNVSLHKRTEGKQLCPFTQDQGTQVQNKCVSFRNYLQPHFDQYYHKNQIERLNWYTWTAFCVEK